MEEYLYRVTIEYSYFYKGERTPIYAVAQTKEAVRDYVLPHLRQGCKIKNIVLLGQRLCMNMYYGKPKK